MSITETLEQLGLEYGDKVYKADGTMYYKPFVGLLNVCLGTGAGNEVARITKRRNIKRTINFVQSLLRASGDDDLYDADGYGKSLELFVDRALGNAEYKGIPIA